MDLDLVARSIAVAILAATIVLSHRFGGWRVSNLPLWSALGIAILYGVYIVSGLEFGNGRSALAEVCAAAFALSGALAFQVGASLAGRRSTTATYHAALRAARFPAVSRWFIAATAVLALIFFTSLTEGAPWRIVTEGVELKWARLEALSDKDALLLNLDALVFAATLFGLAWSIVSYRDDKRSRNALLAFLLLLLLYVMSTGSRTPLLAVVGQVMPALAIARLRSRVMAAAVRRSGLALVLIAVLIGLMVATTGARVAYESLDEDVFGRFFDIVDFGITGALFRAGNSFAFFAATAIVYAAGTFNNLVLRIQEVTGITPSLGYKFVFFYVSALRVLLGGWLGGAIDDWRNVATANNEHLLGLSGNANQWATPYGDIVWDFGLAGAFFVVFLSFAGLGWLVARARRRPDFSSVMLATTVIGFSLLPLVNPLLSLHVHFSIILTLVIAGWRRSGHVRPTVPRRTSLQTPIA